MATSEHPRSFVTHPNKGPDRLAVFAFLWACQALVHQEFYASWLKEGNPFGWALTIAALAVLLKPRSLFLFAVMLASSVIYNVLKWPYVVNHILMESVVNLTILGAIGWQTIRARPEGRAVSAEREQVFDRFAPVVRWMLVAMYYFAFVAKLNYDFFDPELSCVAAMYDDLLRRLPFVPTDRWAIQSAIWSTVVIEGLIPVLLTFRRTKYLALLIGMTFHLMLGLIGHRTFSGLAYAVYALFLIEPLTEVVGAAWRSAVTRLGDAKYRLLANTLRAVALLGAGLLIGADLTGNYRSGFGPFLVFRVAWAVWIAWSLLIIAIYVAAMRLRMRRPETGQAATPAARPGFLWVMLPLVIFNGMSQYLGLKTETCFTMYSNLRTEGGVNNHLFMPALRVADYQDDLVKVLETDHPELVPYVENERLLTYFEFRRIVSETKENFAVAYRHNGEIMEFQRQAGAKSNDELARKHPRLLAKLLYFRPVPEGSRMPCQH